MMICDRKDWHPKSPLRKPFPPESFFSASATKAFACMVKSQWILVKVIRIWSDHGLGLPWPRCQPWWCQKASFWHGSLCLWKSWPIQHISEKVWLAAVNTTLNAGYPGTWNRICNIPWHNYISSSLHKITFLNNFPRNTERKECDMLDPDFDLYLTYKAYMMFQVSHQTAHTPLNF